MNSNNQSYITIIQDPYPPLNNSPELFDYLNHQTSPSNVIVNDDLLAAANNVSITDLNDYVNTNCQNGYINNYMNYNKTFMAPMNLKKEENYLSTTVKTMSSLMNNSFDDHAIDMKDFY